MTRAPLAPVRLVADDDVPDQLADRVCENPRAAGALLELLQRLDAVELADDGRPADATATRLVDRTTKSEPAPPGSSCGRPARYPVASRPAVVARAAGPRSDLDTGPPQGSSDRSAEAPPPQAEVLTGPNAQSLGEAARLDYKAWRRKGHPMSEGQASTDAARQDQSEAALPLLFQRGVVIRLQILATLVLVVLIGGLVSDTFRNSLEPVGFPLFAAVAYPYVLLIGWVVYRLQTLLYRLRQTPSAN